MTDILSELANRIHLNAPSEGLNETPVPGVYCLKFSETMPPTKRHHRACLGIIAQGTKEIILGHKPYRCGGGHYALTPIDLPVISRMEPASLEKPFLCLLMGFDPLLVSEVSAQLDQGSSEPWDDPVPAAFMAKASDPLLDASLRLVKLCQHPADSPILAPLVIKEIFYHLLKGTHGAAIRQFARSGSKSYQVSQAIYRLRSQLTDDVDVAALAESVNMSRSAFFKYFKEVTAVSPIQYQKRLRLLEARRLMTEDGETAESSAFKVGYNSPSQFSREYSRMFGDPPYRNAARIKLSGRPIHEV